MELPTGEVEIAVTELCVLAKSETPPFEIVENSNVKEELRLKHRYLDLRRPDVQEKIIGRHKIVKVARDYFDKIYTGRCKGLFGSISCFPGKLFCTAAVSPVI